MNTKKLAIYTSNSHIIVNGIELHELNNGGSEVIDVSKLGFMRFEVTGTNSDTGLRSAFIFVLTCTLTVAQRGELDLKYVYRLVDETVESILTANGYFITGERPHGEQFERMFERAILNPANVVCNITTRLRLLYEGRKSCKSIAELGGIENALKEFQKRTFLLSDGETIFPFLADKTPKWGRDIVEVETDKELLKDELVSIIADYYETSRVLPASRKPLKTIYRFSENGDYEIVERKLRLVKDDTRPNTVQSRPKSEAKVEQNKARREYADALEQLDRTLSRARVTRSNHRLNYIGNSR